MTPFYISVICHFLNKICTEIKSIKDFKYLLWGNYHICTEKSNIEDFNNYVKNSLCIENKSIKKQENVLRNIIKNVQPSLNIYVEFPNFLIDIILHINSTLKRSVRLDCIFIDQYLNNILSDTDWISEKYNKVNLNISDTSNIILKPLKDNINNNFTIKIIGGTNKYFNINTKANIKDIKKNTNGCIFEFRDNIYYSFLSNDVQDVYVDSKIDIYNNIGCITGKCINTDKYDYIKKIFINENQDIIKFIFENENYVCINEVYYFKRLGIKIYKKEERFYIKKIKD